MLTAIEVRYRHNDTAARYGNERGVGNAVRECGVPRHELFVTTKVWNDDIRAGRIEAAFAESMQRLGLEQLDLYLLHWPIKGRHQESWRAMERLHRTDSGVPYGIALAAAALLVYPETFWMQGIAR